MKRNVVFATTCKGRTQHLEETLPKNLADNHEAKFVILNYNSQDHLLSYLKDEFPAFIANDRIAVYSCYDSPTFKMAHAKNMSHRCAILEGADVIVNLDADNMTGKDFDLYVLEKFEEDDVFLWSRMIKSGADRLPRGISGRIAVSRNAFLNVGGYDEKYETWGPDDKCFNTRLRNIGYIAHEVDKRHLQGLLHNDKMRFREYPHAQTDQDGEAFEQVRYCKTTISNFGNFGCGIVYRNFDNCKPIKLDALPTRIFGIGMMKTGTSSLHQAFQTLGFESAHWKSAHWAKAIWCEMKEQGRSPTLEKSYSLCDTPINILYQELDKAYPGSKFILTTRDENKWIVSAENHWNPDVNPFRSAWDSDPFSHKIHKEIFGTKNFNPEIFLERFRRHNAEVLEYFRDRQKDLLVIDIDRQPTWGPLCEFLGKKIPVGEYPQVFKTKKL